MRTRFILFAVSALVISACARNNDLPEPEGMQMTITAYQEGYDMTRSTILDGGTQVYWEPADEIKVFFKGASGRFVSTNTENATVTDFSGTISVIAGANEGAGSNNLIWGLYPYRGDAIYEGSSVTTTLPAEQIGRAGSFAKNTHITLAQSAGLDLAFYNVCGGLRFSLTQGGIKKVTFEGNHGEAIAGRIKVAFADGVPSIQEVTEGQTMVTLTAPNGGAFQTGQWYYISAIPSSLSNGYKMVFYKEKESAELTSSGSVSFKRGVFGSLTDIDEGLVFKENGGDTPDPDAFIQFVDPIAKYACVEKYDKNGDGEVSYNEAAAVTSLQGLFTDWDTVTRFDEIKYFTGVNSTVGVFDNLSLLESISLPDNITEIGSFKNCFSLKTAILPAAASSIPSACFSQCSSLSDVTLPTGITTITAQCFQGCSALKTISLPPTVTSIEPYSFSRCASLSTIELPSGLSRIDYNAFEYCRALSSIEFPPSLNSVDAYAFWGCSALVSVRLKKDFSVGQYSFKACTSLISASFEDGVSIGPHAFEGCTSLASLSVGDHVSMSEYALSGCESLTSISLGSGVTLQERVFSGCTALTSVTLPDDLSVIPSGCFQNCTSLSSITWPQALTTIADLAFDGCKFERGGYTLELPSTLTTIGERVFGLLHHLILPSTSPITIASNSFVRDYTILYVPSSMVEMYKVRTKWNNYAEWIRPIEDYPVEPAIGGTIGDVVDLGLSVNWASWNIGASKPEDFGSYFAWGETAPKWDYDFESYKWRGSDKYGASVNKTTLDPEDDVAHVSWGGTWRMPTAAEIQELLSECTSETITEGGVRGCRLTSKKDGYTDRSIFLPGSGYRDKSGAYGIGFGHYRSSSISSNGATYILYFEGKPKRDLYPGLYGLSVRPVCDK